MIANKNERLIRAIKNICKCNQQDSGANDGESNITYDDVVKLYTGKSLNEISDWKDVDLENAEVGTLFKVAANQSESNAFYEYMDSHTVYIENCGVSPVNATQTFIGDYEVYQIVNSPTVVTDPDGPFV